MPLHALTDLLGQYLAKGDLIGFINAVYTNLIGEFWFAIPLLFITLPLYLKTGSLEFVAIVWMLTGSALIAILPAMASTVGTIFLVLGIGILLYRTVRYAL